jgi:hypothetical protein
LDWKTDFMQNKPLQTITSPTSIADAITQSLGGLSNLEYHFPDQNILAAYRALETEQTQSLAIKKTGLAESAAIIKRWSSTLAKIYGPENADTLFAQLCMAIQKAQKNNWTTTTIASAMEGNLHRFIESGNKGGQKLPPPTYLTKYEKLELFVDQNIVPLEKIAKYTGIAYLADRWPRFLGGPIDLIPAYVEAICAPGGGMQRGTVQESLDFLDGFANTQGISDKGFFATIGNLGNWHTQLQYTENQLLEKDKLFAKANSEMTRLNSAIEFLTSQENPDLKSGHPATLNTLLESLLKCGFTTHHKKLGQWLEKIAPHNGLVTLKDDSGRVRSVDWSLERKALLFPTPTSNPAVTAAARGGNGGMGMG